MVRETIFDKAEQIHNENDQIVNQELTDILFQEVLENKKLWSNLLHKDNHSKLKPLIRQVSYYTVNNNTFSEDDEFDEEDKLDEETEAKQARDRKLGRERNTENYQAKLETKRFFNRIKHPKLYGGPLIYRATMEECIEAVKKHRKYVQDNERIVGFVESIIKALRAKGGGVVWKKLSIETLESLAEQAGFIEKNEQYDMAAE